MRQKARALEDSNAHGPEAVRSDGERACRMLANAHHERDGMDVKWSGNPMILGEWAGSSVRVRRCWNWLRPTRENGYAGHKLAGAK